MARGRQRWLSGRALIRRIEKAILVSRLPALGLLCLGLAAVHYLFLGFPSWDGFSFRVPPIVELLQHGDLGSERFSYTAAQHFYPFFELIHFPFLRFFGMTGLLLGFSLILLPASVISVYLFVRELTENRRWATYSALAFVAIPFVNTQPFSGYVDFAVVGAFAFFLYVLLRVLKAARPSPKLLGLLSIATFIFTMSRQQAPYLALMIGISFAAWFKPRLKLPTSHEEAILYDPRQLRSVVLAFVIGILPASVLHAGRYLVYGSPIYPYQFRILSFSTEVGISLEAILAANGITDFGWRGMLGGFVRGWLWPNELPANFYDARILGVGILFWLMLFSIPWAMRILRRQHVWVLILFAGIALLVQDFWQPRFSMTMTLALVVCLGAGVSSAATRGSVMAYLVLLSLIGVHLARPMYDVYMMTQQNVTYYRANLTGSEHFVSGPGELEVYEDLQADFYIVPPIINEFTLLLYGRGLTNRIAGIVDPDEIANSCSLPVSKGAGRQVLIVDQTGILQSRAEHCGWECVYERGGICRAGRLLVSG